MAGCVQSDEGEISARLDRPDLGAVVAQLQILDGRFAVGRLAGPLESVRPGLIAQPVADVIRVTLLNERLTLAFDEKRKPRICSKDLRRRLALGSWPEC